MTVGSLARAVRYGATQDEWQHFAAVLQLTEDLLPVVSNPGAVISPQSTLKTVGKVPSRYNAQHQVVGIKDWTQLKATMPQIRQWSVVPDYGICLQTRHVRALDIDIDDRAQVARVVDAVLERCGSLPLRVREGSERALFAFQLEGDSLEKRVLRLAEGAIELLADGQQFIAAGTHPKGGRYRWATGLPSVIPVVPRETFEALWAALGGDTPAKRERRLTRHPAEGDFRWSLPDPVAIWLQQRGWVIEGAPDGELRIACPWKFDHTSDSGPTETVYFPAGTGGYEQGHFQCLHAHCEARTDAEFLEAIGFAQSFESDFEAVATFGKPPTEPLQPRSPPTPDAGVGSLAPATPQGDTADTGGTLPSVDAWSSAVPGMGLKKGKKGWLPVLENLIRALDTQGFWVRLGYDDFRGELVWSSWNLPQEQANWQRMTNELPVAGRHLLGQFGFEPVGRELMRDAVELVAHRRRFDSAQLWLGRLTWDRVSRVERFLADWCGATAGAYASAVSRYLWTALAGRVIAPGTRADMVPILVGPQGAKKTRGVESLAPWPEAYATVDLSVRDAELVRRMRGVCVLELNELRGLHTREAQSIKSFVTERVDKWIPKYQEFAAWMSRRGIFIGTTDREDFLDDESGNRRWLPIQVARFAELTAADREQFWAEGARLFLSDGVAWADAELLARAEHEDYRIVDVWEDEVQEWLKGREQEVPFSLRDVAVGIGLDPREVNRGSEMRLAKVLRSLGGTRTRELTEDGKKLRLWKFWQKTN